MKIEQLKKYLEDRIKSVDETYERELPLMDVGEGHKVINISYLSKKEKEDVINKRNCLLVQKAIYQEILEVLNEERKNAEDN
jgi:hypothetical protein